MSLEALLAEGEPLTKHGYRMIMGVLAVAIAGLFAISNVAAQTEFKSPAELIKYLTYQSGRLDMFGTLHSGVFSCGPALADDRGNRALTKSLVNFGPAALPDLEGALDSFEARGPDSEVALEVRWLLLAYARLRGPAAYPRLHRMYSNPRVISYSGDLDGSVALAFGFTSYLSALNAAQMYEYHDCVGEEASHTLGKAPCEARQTEQPMRYIHCDRGDWPRDSLDRLVSAWQAGNRVSVEASLGPSARSALDAMLVHSSWKTLRKRLWPGASDHAGAMGYRLNVPGRWSEPEETLEEEREWTRINGDSSGTLEIETMFYDGSGKGCGKRQLSLLATPEPGWHSLSLGRSSTPVPGPTEYLIDNSNISDLLRLVGACTAGRPTTKPIP